ncbi:MAG TPA: serine/threonine-protein kinase [Nitrospiraceae bacterium]|nr:serine/threonine-protein kinase [Nitrospiraceae bacterium]
MSESWSRLSHYAMAILFTLLIGSTASYLPALKNISIGVHGLRASHMASFIGYGGSLMLLWLLSHRASQPMPDDGGALAFLRAILKPSATVIIVLAGYKLLVHIDASATGTHGRPFYNSAYAVGLVSCTAWLTVAWLRHAGDLMKYVAGLQWPREGHDATVRLSGSADRLWPGVVDRGTSNGTLRLNGLHPSLGRYEIIKELGRGSMGIVYLGKDPTINRSVAIKTMRLDQIDDPDELNEFRERFFREAESTGRLSHPNIVTIYDAGEERQLGYIAMELLDGLGLNAWCRKANLLPINRAIEIAAVVAEALEYAHRQGVVHRDIKPANIMVRKDRHVKVMDFGIARMTTSVKTQTKVILGTPSYMSPEQLNGMTVDGRADVFSLGVVLFELLTGEKPFEADTISSLMFKIAHGQHPPARSIRTDLPLCCEAILDRALQKDPANRYESAGTLAQALCACRTMLPADLH